MLATHFRNRLLTRITAPATEPLTLDETKSYLRVDHDTEDALVTDLIVTARMTAENWLRRSLIDQSWKLGYDDCLPERVNLPMGPVTAITDVTIISRDGSQQLVDASAYALSSAKNQLVFDTEVQGFHIEIRYSAGYGSDGATIPAPLRQGMLCHMASLYEHRGEVGGNAIPEQAFTLYAPYREVLL